MGRWEPGASGRLRAAALELYLERGFEQTTVAEIAQRAGVTARTFFRYFGDKREVLFAGSESLQAGLVTALESVPQSATSIDAVRAALDAAASMLGARYEYSRQRKTVIVANPELQERELIKMASLSAALADGLRRRGVGDPDASLSAEIGIAVLRVGYKRWVNGPRTDRLTRIIRESFDQAKVLSTG